MNTIKVARGNLKRRPFRSIAIVFSVAIVAAITFSITMAVYSIEEVISKNAQRLGTDVMVIPEDALKSNSLISAEPLTFYMDKSVEERVRGVNGVTRTSSQTFLKTLRLGCCTIGNVQLVGYDPESDFTITPWFEEKLGRPLKPNEVMIGDNLIGLIIEGRTEPDSDASSTVRLFGEDFTIAGMLDDTGLDFVSNSIFITYDALRNIAERPKIEDIHQETARLIREKISSIFVETDPAYGPSRTAIFIEAEIDGIIAVPSENIFSTVRKDLFMTVKSFITVSIILWVTALLLIGVIFFMIGNERKKEIGLLRAMGAKKGDMFKILICEALMLSFIGGVTGIICGSLLILLSGNSDITLLSIQFQTPSLQELILLYGACIGISLITGTGGALYSAKRAAALEPFECIGSED